MHCKGARFHDPTDSTSCGTTHGPGTRLRDLQRTKPVTLKETGTPRNVPLNEKKITRDSLTEFHSSDQLAIHVIFLE